MNMTKNKNRSYRAKFNVGTVDKILEVLGEKVERPIKVNGNTSTKNGLIEYIRM